MKGDVLDNNIDVNVQEVIVIKGSVRSAEDMNEIKELLDWPPEVEAVEGQFQNALSRRSMGKRPNGIEHSIGKACLITRSSI